MFYYHGNRMLIHFEWWWTYYMLHEVAQWVECLPMVQETGVQFQVESYQRLKKNGT